VSPMCGYAYRRVCTYVPMHRKIYPDVVFGILCPQTVAQGYRH
jgi:hypothetical protein